jgi:hypothetical protein
MQRGSFTEADATELSFYLPVKSASPVRYQSRFWRRARPKALVSVIKRTLEEPASTLPIDYSEANQRHFEQQQRKKKQGIQKTVTQIECEQLQISRQIESVFDAIFKK